MVRFFPYILWGITALALSLAVLAENAGQSSAIRKNDPQVKREAKKQEDAKQEDAKREDTGKAGRSAAAGGSVRKEDIDDDGKNKKEKD